MTSTRKDCLDALATLVTEEGKRDARDFFAAEPGRLDAMAFDAAGLHIDFSKQNVSQRALDALVCFAESCDLAGARAAMASGAELNATEGRAVLHMALRGSGEATAEIGAASAVLTRAEAFADAIRSGARAGSTGKRFRHVIHIGIGGSDLGPRLLIKGLKAFASRDIEARFVASVDPVSLAKAVEGCDPESTLVFIVSKSFGTAETKANGEAAKAWLAQHLGADAVPAHLAAASANPKAAGAFGVPADAVFDIWDWVGGRYSLWSAVSLTAMILLGPDNFRRLLAGAAAMDRHFLNAPLVRNAPVLMALIGFWNRSLLGAQSLAVVPYATRLALFPAYLQQLIMESLGKQVTLQGGKPAFDTGAVVWGAEGPNGQHAFFQLLHQGMTVIPADLVMVTEDSGDPGRTRMLLANAVGQAEALLKGRSLEDARAELAGRGVTGAEAERIAPHMAMPGGRPSTAIVLPRLEPETLGALIALYEHMVFTQAVLWNINAFDQYGVELGKTLASALERELATGDTAPHDPSTKALIARVRAALTERADR